MSNAATQQSIRSIMRRSSLRESDKLNILTFCAHERYEQTLCNTGHNFYSMKTGGKTWNTDYGKIPNNYQEIDIMPWHVGFDLILCHSSCERISIANDIQKLYNIPIIRHTHVLPDIRFNVEQQVKGFNAFKTLPGEPGYPALLEVDHDSFISEYNMRAWGREENSSTSFIEHGIDVDFWGEDYTPVDRVPICLSVVNEWARRDWCCGWELWKETVKFEQEEQLPISVLGNNPGLSEPASSLEALRGAYRYSTIFLNTSIHSPVPTSLMEAMACGCAVVSADNCMIPEVIQHGENGLLGNTAEELREHCMYLLTNPDYARKLGENARATIKTKYSLDRFVKDWNKQFFNVIHNYRK